MEHLTVSSPEPGRVPPLLPSSLLSLAQLMPLSFADSLPLPLWIGEYGEAGWCNQCWQAGIESKTQSWLQCVHAEERERARASWLSARQSATELKITARLQTANGQYRWHELHGAIIPLENQLWQIFAIDIHNYIDTQRQLFEQAQLRERMLNACVDCIKMLKPDGRLEQMNRSGFVALGLTEGQQYTGISWLSLLPEEVRRRAARALVKVRQGQPARFVGIMKRADKSLQHWDNILTPVQDASGQTTNVLCVSREITLQRIAEQRLRQASDVDELTGLHNRRYLRGKLRSILSRAKAQQKQLGLLLVDLDYFKHINDTLGHPAGDYFLKQMAKRLRKHLPAQAVIARLGGDEFAIVLADIDSERPLLALAELACKQLEQPITYSGKPMAAGMSIGAAIYPQHAHDEQELMKAADTALHDLKTGGRGGVRLYCERMQLQARAIAQQLLRAREVVASESIVPFYQPKVHLLSGALVGFEALMRWRSAAQQQVQLPSSILEAFNDYHLATQLGEQMQHAVLRDLARWLQAGLPAVTVSINAAPVEFLRDDYAEHLLDKLSEYRVPPQLIEVEVTEHILHERGSELVARALLSLKRAGVRIALDDFGTGHSSLANLRDYPVDCLKIDCGFVWRITEEPSIRAIVQAVAQLGPSLGIDVVAEGVETEQQLQALLQAGCTIGQGCYWSDALAAADVEQRYFLAKALTD